MEDQKTLAEIELDAAKRFATLPSLPLVPADAAFLNQTFDQKHLQELISKQQVFVAEEESGAVVGFIIVTEKSGGAYIEEVDVLNSHGRKGIGKALIERSFAWSREQGFNKIYLRTASNVPWNAPMYARLGFNEIPASNWSDAMKAVDVDEQSKGLPVADRIFMELSL